MDKNWIIYANERGLTGTLPEHLIDRKMPSGAPTCSECKRLMWNCTCESECDLCGETLVGQGLCGDCYGGDE
jgi:hypothetical protein